MIAKTPIQNFVAGFVKKPAPETVESFAKKMTICNNHEMWYSCNSCGDQFDVKKELKFICPTCGSVDLRIG